MKEPLDILDILGQIRANKIEEIDLGLKLARISASQCNRLFKFLSKAQSVKTLDLGCNRIEESKEMVKKLCEVIENNKSITTMELFENTFTTSQLELFAKALSKNLTITIFTYSYESDDAYTHSNAILIIKLCLERNQNIATLNRCSANSLSGFKNSEQALLNNHGHLLFKPATSNSSENVFRVW